MYLKYISYTLNFCSKYLMKKSKANIINSKHIIFIDNYMNKKCRNCIKISIPRHLLKISLNRQLCLLILKM